MIGLSIRSKYAVAVVFELALSNGDAPIQISKLASSRSVPKKYLEQILIDLKKQGILASVRGSQGGYLLAKAATEIRVSDIVEAMEGKAELGNGYCGGNILQVFWESVDTQFVNSLAVRISSLVEKKKLSDNCLTFNI